MASELDGSIADDLLLLADDAPLPPPEFRCRNLGCQWIGPTPVVMYNRKRVPPRHEIRCPTCSCWIADGTVPGADLLIPEDDTVVRFNPEVKQPAPIFEQLVHDTQPSSRATDQVYDGEFYDVNQEDDS